MVVPSRTNLPKEIMAFPDFPFDASLPSFVMHHDVLNYLQKYADHFELERYIQVRSGVGIIILTCKIKRK